MQDERRNRQETGAQNCISQAQQPAVKRDRARPMMVLIPVNAERLSDQERRAEFTARRCANASYFNAKLVNVMTPHVKEGYEHVWHQYTIRITNGRDRDAAVKQLNDAGIGTGIFYPVPAHRQAHIHETVREVQLPVTEQLANEVISLPVHPQLSQADLDMIVAEVNKL